MSIIFYAAVEIPLSADQQITAKWIGLLTTIAQIGLGAVIAGVTAYTVAKRTAKSALDLADTNHRNQSKQAYLSRRRAVLEDVVKEIDEIHQAATSRATILNEWATSENCGELDSLNAVDAELQRLPDPRIVLGLFALQSRLVLMNCTGIAPYWREYVESITSLPQTRVDFKEGEGTTVRADDLYVSILTAIEAAYSEI